MPTLTEIVNHIVDKGNEMVTGSFPHEHFVLDFVAIFTKDENEKNSLEHEINNLGSIVHTTSTGNIYRLTSPLETSAGKVFLIQLRNPDSTRPQRGEPDFRGKDYEQFKHKYGQLPGMRLIERPEYEMLELRDPQSDVLVYFPNKPLGLELGVDGQ